jgi:hypothetical protein
MAQTILVFDFGTDEDAAQQARHKLEGWKQGFRLGDKIALKFERPDTTSQEAAPAAESAEEKKSSKNKKKAASKSAKSSDAEKKSGGRVRLMVRLGFSDHEKLTQQRWLDRIPSEEPFKSAKPEVIKQSDPNFGETIERFETPD